MKKIFLEIRDHIKEDFNKKAYLFAFIYTFGLLAIVYSFNLSSTVLFKDFGTPKGILVLVLFYFFAYYSALIPILYFKKKLNKLKSTEFWVKTLSLIFIFSFFTGFYELDYLAMKIGSNKFEDYYLSLVFTYSKKFFPLLIIMLILKLIYDQKDNHFYGLQRKGLNYAPYLLFLVFILPFVFLASRTNSFLDYYPRFQFWLYPDVFGLKRPAQILLFESAYAISFVTTEMLFRGALVIGLAKILNKETVLAMAMFYCFSHFGKPMGEAISAFLGGYILGVIALNHKNINGGVIVHIGLAMLMEATAVYQHLHQNI